MKLGVTVARARVRHGDTPTLAQYEAFAGWAAAAGFSGIELAAFTQEHFASEFSDSASLRRLGKLCGSLGLVVDAFEAGFLRHWTVSGDAKVRRQAVIGLERSLDVALDLGADLVYLHSAPHPSWTVESRRLYDEFTPPVGVRVPKGFDWEGAWQQYVGVIEEMAGLAEREGVRLALEIRPFEMVSNADGMCRLLEAVGSPALGVVFDTAHFLVQKEVLPVAISKLQGRIFLVHLADNDGDLDYHWAPGRGAVPWEDVMGALRESGYDGFANIDVAGSFDDIDAEIAAGSEFVRKWIAP